MAKSAFLPIALGVGALLVASSAGADEKKPKPPAPGGGGGGFPPVPGGGFPTPPIPPNIPGIPGFPSSPAPSCTLDAHMPEAIKQATQSLLGTPAIPAAQLQAAAQIADANGYPLAAQCLREEAQKRGGPQQPPGGFDPLDPTTWPEIFPGGFPGMPTPGQPGQPQPGQPPPPPGGGTPPPPPPGGGQPPPPPGQGGGGTIYIPGYGEIPIPPGFPVPTAPTSPEGKPFTVRTGDRPYGIATYYTGDGARFRELEPLNPQLGQLNAQGRYPGWVPGAQILLPALWNPWDKPEPPTGL